MRPRQLGLVLIVIGVAGLTLTSIGWAAGPMGWMAGPRGMSSMYGWMHGSVEGASAAPEPSPGADEVRVAAREFSFAPSELNIPSGRTVNLVLANEGDLLHDIIIPSVGFRLTATSGATASGALTLTEPGRLEFFCSVPGHREAGMSGTVVVT